MSTPDPRETTEAACTCPYTDPSMWLSAASCGYGDGYEPGSMQEWDPDCPVHPAYPCGHCSVTAGCGGCDPAAIEAVCDDDTRTWRAFDPVRDLTTPPVPVCATPDAADRTEGEQQ